MEKNISETQFQTLRGTRVAVNMEIKLHLLYQVPFPRLKSRYQGRCHLLEERYHQVKQIQPDIWKASDVNSFKDFFGLTFEYFRSCDKCKHVV